MAAGAGVAPRRRGARLREVVVHLPPHAFDLLRDRGGQLGLARRLRALGILIENRQRGLQPVREIAGLGQRARDALFTIVKQAVEIGDQRHDLGGILAFEPPLAALLHAATGVREARRTSSALS